MVFIWSMNNSLLVMKFEVEGTMNYITSQPNILLFFTINRWVM